MSKKLFFIFMLAAVLALGAKALPTLAQTDPSVEALQKQIQLLLSQMQALQQQVTTLRTSPVTTQTTPTTAPQTTMPTATTILPPTTTPTIGADDELTAERGTIPPPNIFRTLRRGSRGNDVRALQEYLAQDPTIYPQGFITGFFGPSTETAVKRWQAKYGLDAVGNVGPKTIAKLIELRQLISPEPELVENDNVYPRPDILPVPKPTQCPALSYMPICREGQSPFNKKDCQVCRPKPQIEPDPLVVCPSLPTVDRCPADQEKVVTYKSEQCGVYYACKPRETAPQVKDIIATLKKVSSIQTDNRYNAILNSPNGIQKFAIYNAKGAEIQLGYPACRKEWTTPIITADSAEFPLKLVLADCASSQYSTTLSTSVVVQPISEGLTFPYTFSNGKIVNSSNEARSYCYANGPGSGQSVAGECETKFGVVYTTVTTTTTSGRAIYLADSFAACMAKYGFSAEAKQVKAWAQSSDAIPWSALSNAAQAGVQTCEREYYGQQTVETGSVLCTDGKDNDGDGFVDGSDPSCSSSVVTTIPAGQKEQVWNSLGLKSWIRTDADSGRIEQLKAACASVPAGSNIWTPNAGLSTSADFGMPDTTKCQRASSCTAGQYFDGAACVASTTTTTGTTQCSDGRDNDGDGKIDYPTDTGCYSAADNDETPGTSTTTTDCSRYGTGWHTMDSSSGTCFDTNMTSYRTANSTLYSCATTPTSGCSGTTTTTTSGCDSALTALLGTGCHYMYNDSAGNQTYCDGPMTKSAKRGDTMTTSGCSSSTTGSWPTDQASCTSRGYNWCTSSTSWCQTGSCPTSTTGGGGTYAGDANSCPSFSYSRWDQQNRRYCQLNTETKCDYDYPSYLTASNYTATECPSSGSTTTTADITPPTVTLALGAPTSYSLPVSYTASEESTVIYEFGLTTSYGSTRTPALPAPGSMNIEALSPGTTYHIRAKATDRAGNIGYSQDYTFTTTPSTSTSACITTPSACTTESQCTDARWYWYTGQCWSSPQTTTTTSSCPNSQLTNLLGSGCHFMYSTPTGNIYCDGPMTKSAREGDTAAASGCQSPTTTTTTTTTTSCAGTPASCSNETQCWGASYYWYDASCHSSPQTTTTTTTTSSSSCPSGYHSMGNYCMSDSNSTQCQPTGGGATYTCSTAPTAAVYDTTAHLLSQAKSLLRSLSNSLRGIRR